MNVLYADVGVLHPCAPGLPNSYRACNMQGMAQPFAGYEPAISRLWARNKQVMSLPFAGYVAWTGGKRVLKAARQPVRQCFSCRLACCNSFFEGGGNVNVLTNIYRSHTVVGDDIEIMSRKHNR